MIHFRLGFIFTYFMKIAISRILLLALLIQAAGCASIYTQSHDAYVDAKVGCSDSKTIPNIYSGSVFDLYCISKENVGFFCLVDLPLSLVIDSLILPYTVYKQSKYGSWYQQSVCQEKINNNKSQ